MEFFMVETCPLANGDYAVVTDQPTDTGLDDYRMSIGEPMGELYPDDARVFFSPRYPGIILGDLVANTRALFIVSAHVQRRLAAQVQTAVEYLPLAIHNHKKRLASGDYFIVNPLGTFDCLDLQRSEIEWADADVVGIDKYVLAPDKLREAPDLFRIREDPRTYVMSRRLVTALLSPAPSNFYVHPLEQ